MEYHRQHLATLKSRMAEPRRRIQIIMGPRQVGKSTLIYQFCEGMDTPYDYFSGDNANRFDTSWIPNRWQEARMKMDLHGDKERILIIDEVQKIDGWSEQVKKEWDEDTRRKRNLKVILLGSSRVLLQKGLNESLEGRFEPLKMGYWEWSEMRDAFGFTMQQYIYFGGFPGLALDIHDEDRWRGLMEDTVITPILSRDILEIEEIRNPALLRQVFELASIESARELSLTKMQGTMNSGTVPTIKNYLNVLDQTMTVKPMQKYAPSVIKEKNSIPKMQIYNSAFRNCYGRFTFEEAVTNPSEWGRQVESAVGAHLANRSQLDTFELLYWRNNNKKECDYVLKKGQSLVAIEVKSSSADDTSGFEEFKNLFSKQITAAFIVGPEGLPLEDFFSLDLKKLFLHAI